MLAHIRKWITYLRKLPQDIRDVWNIIDESYVITLLRISIEQNVKYDEMTAPLRDAQGKLIRTKVNEYIRQYEEKEKT